MPRQRLFSGIQPSGVPTLGNYVGAIRNWRGLADDYDGIFSVVDLHALTQVYPIEEFQQRSLTMAATILASGLTPDKATLFVQSHVPQHSELAWRLSTVTMMGELNRMTQFKDKSERQADNINAGLFTYPTLMAADILLYRAEAVPVGNDQLQHLELARDVARRFNQRVDQEVFPEPKGQLSQVPRLMGLDGQSKMSKSAGNYIGLVEPAKDTLKKLKSAVTDPQRVKKDDPGDPAKCPVIYPLHTLFSPKEQVADVEDKCRSAGMGCVECKKWLHGNMEAEIEPIRDAYHDWMARPSDLQDVLEAGRAKVSPIAQETLARVDTALGMLPRQSP